MRQLTVMCASGMGPGPEGRIAIKDVMGTFGETRIWAEYMCNNSSILMLSFLSFSILTVAM